MESLHAHTSGDPTQLDGDDRPIEAVRTYCGDTDPKDLLLTDPQIAFFLDETSTLSDDDTPLTVYHAKLAAAECCDMLARRYAREADKVNAGAEGRSVSIRLEQRAATFRLLAKDLREQDTEESGTAGSFAIVGLLRA
jgi:hypothetical protein